jgi:threonine dehydratase
LKRQSDLDIIVAPIGGGGLMSGTSTIARALMPGIEVIGAEPINANDAWQSFNSGHIVPSVTL